MINFLQKYKRIIKYLIAGGTAASVDLVLLYILTDILGVWYLISACVAFSIAFFVSFFLQKFWTFRDRDKEVIYKQMRIYLIVALANLALNAVLMYALVDGFKIWYMLAQFIISGLIAIESYLVYKHFIFNKNSKTKILIATGIYPPDIGGPAQYAKNLVEQFTELGYEVKVLSYRLEKKLPIGLRHILYFLRVMFNLSNTNLIIALDTFSVGMPAVIAAIIFNKKIIIRTGGDFLWESYVERSGDLVTLKQFYEIKPGLILKEKIIFILSR
ncbi:MAG: GtrA family protein, partial [bacterium]